MQKLDLEESLPKLHAIHVAGTKGKGSTCAMVESILRSCGYRTGLFTSPHLMDVRERIRIDGYVYICMHALQRLCNVYKRVITRHAPSAETRWIRRVF